MGCTGERAVLAVGAQMINVSTNWSERRAHNLTKLLAVKAKG